MRYMTNIKCFDLYRGLNSVYIFGFTFLLPSVCKQLVVNGLQELDHSFNKQKIGENGMEVQDD